MESVLLRDTGLSHPITVAEKDTLYLHLRDNYMFTTEVLVPVNWEVFTAWSRSGVEDKLLGLSFICKFTLLFET